MGATLLAAGAGLEAAAVGAKLLKSPKEPKGSLLKAPADAAGAAMVDFPGVVVAKDEPKGSASKLNTEPAKAEALLMGDVLAKGSLK